VAPPGSRVLVSDGATLAGAPAVVPASGSVELRFGGEEDEGTGARRRARLVVTTPAGHAYVADWDVFPRSGPPPIEATVDTPIGSPTVEIRGRTLAHATVRVDGRAVTVSRTGSFAARVDLPPWPTEVGIVVDDQLGNVARSTITAVGWFDYRELPWVPILASAVALAAVVLLLRVPRATQLPRSVDDDSALEELEPD
jgi:hypothetical protein